MMLVWHARSRLCFCSLNQGRPTPIAKSSRNLAKLEEIGQLDRTGRRCFRNAKASYARLVSGHDLSSWGGARFASDGLRVRAVKDNIRTSSLLPWACTHATPDRQSKSYAQVRRPVYTIPAMHRKAVIFLLPLFLSPIA